MNTFLIIKSDSNHIHYASIIKKQFDVFYEEKQTGFANRTLEFIENKIKNSEAVLAINEAKELVGFCYIELWHDEKALMIGGLMVSKEYTGIGIGKSMKAKIFDMAMQSYPDYRVYSLTTSLPTIKMNIKLNYDLATYTEISSKEHFWDGCQTCPFYHVLKKQKFSNCLCLPMKLNKNEDEIIKKKELTQAEINKKLRLYEGIIRFKKIALIDSDKNKKKKSKKEYQMLF